MAHPIGLGEATHLEGGDGRFSVRLSDAWEIWGPSGGYLAAIALRAAGRCAEISRPASFYCHFLSSPAFEEVELAVELLKRGRRSESLAVRMTQGGRPVLHALVRTAADAPGYRHQELAAPEVTPPGESAPFSRILLDTFGWPAAYQRYRGAGYTAPNLDIGVCLHQFATGGEWLLVDHECPIATDGLLGVSGRVWDADGRLLATGNAQLCCVPHGKG